MVGPLLYKTLMHPTWYPQTHLDLADLGTPFFNSSVPSTIRGYTVSVCGSK